MSIVACCHIVKPCALAAAGLSDRNTAFSNIAVDMGSIHFPKGNKQHLCVNTEEKGGLLFPAKCNTLLVYAI